MADPFVCVRQRAGPFVKAFSTDRACFVRRSKDSKGLIRKRAGPAMCRTSVDKLELRLALFGYDGVFYTLTFAPEHLPADLDGVQAVWDAFLKRLARWNRRMGRGGSPDFYVYRIEGLHGDHRYHIHAFLRDSDFPPTVVRYLWDWGEVDDEPWDRLLESGPIFHQGGNRGWAASVGMLQETQPHDTASGGLVQPHRRDPTACRSRAAAYLGTAQSWGVGRVLLYPLSGPGKIALLF